MARNSFMRQALLPLVVIIAIVAIAVPACQMVGCNMPSGGMLMRFVHHGGSPVLSSRCPGEYVTRTGPLGVTPGGSTGFLLSFIAAAIGAVVLSSGEDRPGVLRFVASLAPRPPNDPLQGRLRI